MRKSQTWVAAAFVVAALGGCSTASPMPAASIIGATAGGVASTASSPVPAPNSSAVSAVRAAFPTGAPVTSGPDGGNWCDTTAAWWEPSGSGIVVQINADGPAIVNVAVENAAGDPVGNANGRENEGDLGVEIHVPNLDLHKAIFVSMSIAGTTIDGICEVPRH